MARRRRRRLHRRVRGQEGQAGRGQRLCVRSGDQGILLLLVVPNREQKGATASAKARQPVCLAAALFCLLSVFFFPLQLRQLKPLFFSQPRALFFFHTKAGRRPQNNTFTFRSSRLRDVFDSVWCSWTSIGDERVES